MIRSNSCERLEQIQCYMDETDSSSSSQKIGRFSILENTEKNIWDNYLTTEKEMTNFLSSVKTKVSYPFVNYSSDKRNMSLVNKINHCMIDGENKTVENILDGLEQNELLGLAREAMRLDIKVFELVCRRL